MAVRLDINELTGVKNVTPKSKPNTEVGLDTNRLDHICEIGEERDVAKDIPRNVILELDLREHVVRPANRHVVLDP